MELAHKFEAKGLHASKPLNSELWKSRTEELLSKRSGLEESLPDEAFSLEAEQALKLGDWKRYIPNDLECLESALFNDYLNGWLFSRDQYASWEGDGASFRRDAHLKGKYKGIGVAWDDLRGVNGELLVAWVAPGGPAMEAGIKTGDKVVGMASDERIIDLAKTPLEDISVYVRAADRVTLELACGAVVKVEPSEVILSTGTSAVDEEEATVIVRLRSINEDGLSVLGDGIALANQKNKGLVLDLSGNRGGHTNIALDICGYFKGAGFSGVEWFYRDKWGRSRVYELKSYSQLLWGKELSVIVNDETASAAELIVESLKSRPKTKFLGGPTYGKLESQDLISLHSAGRLRVTVSSFCRKR